MDRAIKLKRQVERILDEGTGEQRSVIVRMESPDADKEALVKLASEALRERNMALSARDLLPVPYETLKKRSPQARGRLLRADESLASKVAALNISAVALATLKSAGLGFIEPLFASETVRKMIGQATESLARAVTTTFWTSKSALLAVDKDDLWKLADEVPQIRDIYPNRRLRVPRLAQPKSVPAPVTEEYASAWGVRRIGALSAWGAYGVRGKGVRVGILDTGVDASHPDLKGKIALWAEFDADGNEVKDSTPHDDDGHGTHCCGTIVGGNASGQWIGVAPEAEIAAALVLRGDKGGTDAQVLRGIDWMVESHVDVISMSLGGLTLDAETPNTYTEAILTAFRAGIPVVTAIGNDGNGTAGSPGNDVFAFAVGATDYHDRAAGFSGGRTQIIRTSNFIAPENLPLPYSKPDVSAPGVAINSSLPKRKWALLNGTSMATPHVAGAIALLLNATSIREKVEASKRAFLIQDLLSGSAEELGESGQNHRFGFGRIDILRAIGIARQRGYGKS